MSDLSKRIADLSPEKRALLELRLEERRAGASSKQAVPPIEPIARDGALPLSFAQQRLWFLDQLGPGSAAYDISAAYHMKGPLDVAVLEQSLNEIVRRHEVLRTTFEAVDGRPIQVIAPALSLTLPVVDLQELPETKREVEAQRLTTEEAQCPFDLAKGPLLRATLLRLREEEQVLLLTMHHIVSDGWSTGVFNRELAVLYEAFSAGKPSPLPELPIQYVDFAVWQREWLQGEVLEEQLAYWREQLGGDLPVLELPTDRPRPAVQTFRGARQSLVLSKTLTEALEVLSRREGVTLSMTLLAAFKALLHRYTGQDDIVIGTPIAGRNKSEVEGLIGLFLNTLVLRTNLSGNPSFRELLARVREVTLGAYAHQDLPFEKLVEELQPERDLSRNPLFDILVNFINTPQINLELPGIIVSSQGLTEPQSKFSMTLYVEEQGSELGMQLVYRRALFSAERMAFFLDQFRYLLEQIVTAPEKTIRSYSLVTPESRPLLPDPSAVLPELRYELVTDMFASWANNTPEHPTIRQGDRTWTYSTLAESAHALAQALLAQGLERGDVVAVSGPRSFGLIASMMGVLLSGGVLLTLDQNLPPNRQRLMLREAGAKYLLYTGGRQPEDEWLEELSSLVIIGVDPDEGWVVEPERILDLEATRLPELTPDDAAYLFFTSGTTGVPKGVLGCHKGLSHFLNWQRGTFAIEPRDRCAQLTALSFDVVLRDIFLPLTSGATLCLPEEFDEVGPDRILSWLERDRISVLHAAPTLVQAWLMDIPSRVSLRNLRWVFSAGESLPAALVHRWREAFPKAGKIVNLYGPTETTLAKCFYLVPSDTPPGIQPVGWPLPETQALALAENGHMCGIGEPGEIVIRTPFRSLGYINAPEENQNRFVKNPFRDDERDLLYYTGDAGRYRPDGSLEILGRLDDQVKIRGVRVEPDEVTATLSQHPAVQSCIVVARNNEEGQTSLVAYVVRSKQDEVSIHELRLYLSKQLPAAMVPSTFVMLDTLPLTPNGKVDRRALPAPDTAKPRQEQAYVAPRTSVEEIFGGIWADVLGLERVDIYDNFFELGGHSLLGTQIISRVCDVFQVKMSLRSLFEVPTVAGLAECIETALRAGQDVQAPPLRPIPRDRELPASFSQERMLLRKQAVPTRPWHVGGAFRVTGSLNVAALEQSLSEVVRRHEALRTSFSTVEGRRGQVVSPPRPLSLPMVDLSQFSEAEREAEVRRLAAEEAERPFDQSQDLLLRATLLRLAREEHVLILWMDHIASDGWSFRVLRREVSALYKAFSVEAPLPLPELPIQYADFAYWQRQWLQGKVLEALLSYWKKQLGGSIPESKLPTDHPRPAVVLTSRPAHQELVLPTTLSESLKALSLRERVTLFMTLLAAFQTLLHRYTGKDDISVLSATANRTRAETEALIGLFAHGIILRTDFSGNPSFRELLGRVREVVLGAHVHQELPFAKLAEALQPEFGFSPVEPPLVFFAFANVPDAPLELPGLITSRLRIDRESAFVDLSLLIAKGTRGLTVSVDYRAELFETATISRVLGHFHVLLEGIVADPQQRLSTLPLS